MNAIKLSKDTLNIILVNIYYVKKATQKVKLSRIKECRATSSAFIEKWDDNFLYGPTE